MGKMFSGGKLFGFLAAIILLVLLAGITLRSREERLWGPEKFVIDAFSSVAGVFYRPAVDIETFFERIGSLRDLYEQNAQLKLLANENATLQIELAQEQNQIVNLEQMLHFRDQVPQFQLVPAEVTGRSPLTWNSQITISAGSADGVRRNMPVLDQDGALVGRVVAVARFNCTAVLLSSTQTADGVSATIVTRGNQPPFGIVTGSSLAPGTLLMQFISQLSTGAKVGDLVVTSGLSDIYPKGILIGRIRSFLPDASGITRSAVLVPSANLNDLNYVFILAPTPAQVTP